MRVRSIAGGVEVLAPAKLNLYLEVLGRRSDGYHEIESVMVTVDWFDTLTVFGDDSGAIALECDDPRLPLGSDNLVVRAALGLRAEVGCGRGARMVLRKAIPLEAGLAGGSSDAAAALVALDRVWGLRLPPGRLDAVAAQLGSDVPFFLHGPSAICRGRGEQVESISLRKELWLVLVAPFFGLSTAEVYRHLQPPATPGSIQPILGAIDRGDTAELGCRLFNRLQPVAESLRPELVRVRDALANLDPPLDGSLMSGSGSAYFGLCRDRPAAIRAAEQLQPLGLGWVRVVTCGPSGEKPS